ncbi:MAG: AtpZ/AtpI family protein [Chitinophagales bacterium]
MDNPSQSPTTNSNKELLRYASLGTQIFVAIGIGVFAGLKLDRWLRTSPLFTVALPLLVLIGIFYKLVRETGKSRNDESK